MDQTFLLQLTLSFLIGGSFVAFATTAAERFGPEVGGIIAGLPSTVAISLLFIALTNSPEAATHATDVIPIVLSLSGAFLVVWALTSSRGLPIAHTLSLLIWALPAFYISHHPPHIFCISLLVFAILVSLSCYTLEKVLALPDGARGNLRFSPFQLLLRACFAGSIIASAVYLNRAGGPYVGGTMAAFPASYLSTISIAYATRGKDFTLSLLRPLLLSGMLTCIVYVLTVRWTYLPLGVFWGTLLAYLGAGLTGRALFLWRMKKRLV